MDEDDVKKSGSLASSTPGQAGARAAVRPDAGTAMPPQSPTIRKIVNEARMDFYAVRDRHSSRLSQVNAELLQVECGPLVAVTISTAARQPGPLAEFLIDIGLNPFGDWNMIYYASDKPSADLMDALLFTPEAEERFDGAFTAAIEEARDSWLRFHGHADAENETAVREFRETLRQGLAKKGEAVTSSAYGDRANRWRNLFPKQNG